jgi:hypothetical protein
MSSEESWDMSASSAHISPKAEADRLENEQNYYVWSIPMKNAFETCEMWRIVDHQMTLRDNHAKAMITQCIKADLVIKVAHAKHAKEPWDTFLWESSQTRSGSIMLWLGCLTKQFPSGGDVSTHVTVFQEAIHYLANAESIMLVFRRLTKQLPYGGDVSTHITGFRDAICYLTNAEFDIPGYIAATILLSTLSTDQEDPHSWNQHVAGVKFDKSTTTLSSVINGILEEKRRLTEDDNTDAQKQEQALATLEQAVPNRGKPYCRNRKREGHTTEECRGIGVDKDRDKQRSTKKKSRGKKKGKEKTHNSKL